MKAFLRTFIKINMIYNINLTRHGIKYIPLGRQKMKISFQYIKKACQAETYRKFTLERSNSATQLDLRL